MENASHLELKSTPFLVLTSSFKIIWWEYSRMDDDDQTRFDMICYCVQHKYHRISHYKLPDNDPCPVTTLEFYYVYFKFQEVCALFQLTFKNIDITTWNQTIKTPNNANRMQDAWHLMHLNIIIWYLINYNSALLVVIVCTKWTTKHYFNT